MRPHGQVAFLRLSHWHDSGYFRVFGAFRYIFLSHFDLISSALKLNTKIEIPRFNPLENLLFRL